MLGPDDHYIIISADTHAGGSHVQYREFLDPKYRDDFDAWREKYKNPFKDLKDTDLRIRNWDDDRRDGDMFAPHWERWAAQEDTMFAREQTRERAELIIQTD